MTDKLVTIARFGNSAEAFAARAFLEDEGIISSVADDATNDMLSIMGAGLGGVELLVHAHDATRAEKLLEEFEEARKSTVPKWICHECSSMVDAGFEVCWSCGADYDPARSERAPDDGLDGQGERLAASSVDSGGGGAGSQRAVLQPGEWRCPSCGLRVEPSRDACPACGASPNDAPNPYITGEAAAEGSGNDEFDRLPETAATRELVVFAWRAAVLGLVMCPGIAQMYSLWLLLRVSWSGETLEPATNRLFYITLAIDLFYPGVCFFAYMMFQFLT